MFVAWRDLKAARGRFLLIGAVVTLITVLVTFLSGLTGGLVTQNISAITGLTTDRVVFTPDQDGKAGYADSTVTRAQADAWLSRPGVRTVDPLGITQGRIQAGDRQQTITLFGGGPAAGTSAPAPGRIVLPETTADDLGVRSGDRVTVAGHTLTVDRIGPDRWYSHLPVADVTVTDWRQLAPPGAGAPFGTVLLVSGQDVDWTAADAAAGTTSNTVLASLTALETFRSEVGSLLLMVALLFGISALVVGAFFTVWSIQRRGDVAVLTALGATTRMLVVDALGQALLVLVLSIGVGLGITVLAATAAGDALPFLLSPVTTLLPAVAMTVLGLAGAAVATRSVTRTDPLIALGSAR
ncbi:ABC transporter substrate-binding protein [Tersicoccus solisilvae]|uniref:ABC transporter substrate-binding protein n=1 Tax=Tersicoccus solisilvae TaxID=1882339 RepID=A0ABQ1P9C8_9MICC|nr:ABC transporter permease [Tersicoccus solisilvae]GGC89367.1 ABC transporter substrate-binding protein [Tersicoccus solisilvae]